MARVLVIEDTPESLELMTYLLTASGYEAVGAGNGNEGLAQALNARPDLIICDIHMPGMDGYEVARRLKARKETAGIPLVAVTALAMVGDSDRILASGFDGYLTKPIAPETLMSQLAAFLPATKTRAPADRGGHATAVAAAPPPRKTPRATLLAVDDVGDNLELIKGIFEPLGYRVRTANSVADALPLIRESAPDLVLSDLHMPDGDGTALLEAVKADPALRDIPFIIISSTASGRSGRTRALTLGACRYILRPIEPDALLSEVQACLGARPTRSPTADG